MKKYNTIQVLQTQVTVHKEGDLHYISLTDILKGKDGDFFHCRLAQKQKHH